MPFKIIRDDITKIQCDAIVNPTNEDLWPGGGIDAAVHQGAGRELFEMCQTLGGLELGKAKITPAYNLPCKYVIHTVGPWWQGGDKNEKESLQSCYKETLKIAKGTKCKSVAFPLISSGTYGYPKDQVLTVALEVIKAFLLENEMLVYLVVFDKTAYALSEQLDCDVAAYIDDNYVNESTCAADFDREEEIYEEYLQHADFCDGDLLGDVCQPILEREYNRREEFSGFGSINEIEKYMGKGFRETLIDFLNEKEMDDVTCYKGANVSRQTWHKIMTNSAYKPTKKTAISLAISLGLNMDETQKLLSTAGFILSRSSLFDVIIMFCIENEQYDVLEVDSILFYYDQETLFSSK